MSDLFRITPGPEDDYSITKALNNNSLELSRRTVSGVGMAIELGLDKIDVAELVIDGEVLVLECLKVNFLFTLNQNMTTLLAFEDYESCAICQKYINKLQKNLPESK